MRLELVEGIQCVASLVQRAADLGPDAGGEKSRIVGEAGARIEVREPRSDGGDGERQSCGGEVC